MKTSKELETAFKADFQALLDKYNAEFQVQNFWTGYPECGEDIQATIYINAEWDQDYNQLIEFTEFNLDKSIQPTKSK